MRERVRATEARVLEGHDQRVRVRRVLCAMAVVVAALVAWWLMGTAYAKTAAPETQSQWEATLPTDLTHSDVDADMASIASSQDGYKQATSVDAQGNRQAWNRYAAAVDGDQSKGWNAYFAAFCLRYAGVDLPDDHDTATQLRDWAKEHGAYTEGAASDVKPGQLLFLKQGAMKDVATTDDGMLVGVVLAVEDGHAKVALGAYESSTSSTPYVEEQKTVSLNSSDVLGVADPAKIVSGNAGSSAASADADQTSTAAAAQTLAAAPAAASADQDGSVDGASASDGATDLPTVSSDTSANAQDDLDVSDTTYVHVSDSSASGLGVSVSVTLLADGQEKGTVTLSSDNGWDHTWSGLPRYNSDGSSIVYSVKAASDDNGTTSVVSTKQVSSDTDGQFKQVTTDKLPSYNEGNPYIVVNDGFALARQSTNYNTLTTVSADSLTSATQKPDTLDLFTASAIDSTTNSTLVPNSDGNDFTLSSAADSTWRLFRPSQTLWGVQKNGDKTLQALHYDAASKQLAFERHEGSTNLWPLGTLSEPKNANMRFAIDKTGSQAYELYEWLPSAGTDVELSTAGAHETDPVTNDQSDVDLTTGDTTFVHVSDGSLASLGGSVQVRLLADGQQKDVQTLDSSNSYDHTWTDLPRYNSDGTAIVYTVQPVQDESSGLQTLITSTDENAASDTKGRFQKVASDALPSFNALNPYLVVNNDIALGDGGSGNTFAYQSGAGDQLVKATTKPADKWLFMAQDASDQAGDSGTGTSADAFRLTSSLSYHQNSYITFQSYTQFRLVCNGNANWQNMSYDAKEQTLSFNYQGTYNGRTSATWPLGNLSSGTTAGAPMESVSNINSGNTQKYQMYEWLPQQGTDVVLTTDKAETTSFTVTKTWADGSTKTPVTVHLTRDGVVYDPEGTSGTDGSQRVLSDSNDWTATWEDLPVYRVDEASGSLVKCVYSTTEDAVAGYQATYSDVTEQKESNTADKSAGTFTNITKSSDQANAPFFQDGKEYIINYWSQGVLAASATGDDVSVVKIPELTNYGTNANTTFSVGSTGISNPYVVWTAHDTGTGGFQLTNLGNGKTLAMFTPDGGKNYYVHTESNPDLGMSTVAFTYEGHGRPVFVNVPSSVPHGSGFTPNFQLEHKNVKGLDGQNHTYLWINRYGKICMNYGLYEWSGKPTKPVQSMTITNTPKPVTPQVPVSVSADKIWQDPDGNVVTAPADHPVSVFLQRSTDGTMWTNVGDSVELNEDNSWHYKWSDLPSEDDNGNKYQYQVVEDANSATDYTHMPATVLTDDQKSSIEAGGVSSDDFGNDAYGIVNKEKTGYTLPSFGGSGTMPFYLLGIASIVAAISSLALRSRAQRRHLQGAGHAAEAVAPARKSFAFGWSGSARGVAGQRPFAKWAGAFVAALAIAVTVALAGAAAPQQAQAQTLSGSVQVQPSEKMAAAGDARVTYDLYKVADVDVDDSGAAVAVHPYDVASDVSLEPGSDSQVAQAANALESRVLLDGVAPTQSRTVAASQTAVFDSLDAGVYLMRVEFASTLELKASASIISIPDQAQGTSVTVSPKVEAVHVPPTPVSLSVAKAWDDGGSGNAAEHPAVKVQLTRDGVAYGDPVELNEQNNWRHSWYELDPGSEWGVVELDVPDGYTVGQSAPTSNDDGTTQEVVIVNTAQTPPPTTPQMPQATPSNGLPATGEQLTVALMLLVAGLACFAVGMAQAARRGRSQGKGGAAHGRR